MAGCITPYPTKQPDIYIIIIIIIYNYNYIYTCVYTCIPGTCINNGQLVTQWDSQLHNRTAGCVTGQLLSYALKRKSRLHITGQPVRKPTSSYVTGNVGHPYGTCIQPNMYTNAKISLPQDQSYNTHTTCFTIKENCL